MIKLSLLADPCEDMGMRCGSRVRDQIHAGSLASDFCITLPGWTDTSRLPVCLHPGCLTTSLPNYYKRLPVRLINIIYIDCAYLPTLQERFALKWFWVYRRLNPCGSGGSAVGKPIHKPKFDFYDPQYIRSVWCAYLPVHLPPNKGMDHRHLR